MTLSDTRNNPPERRFAFPGHGDLGSTFRCAACDKPRPIPGRKRVKLKSGLVDYVCKHCLEEMGK